MEHPHHIVAVGGLVSNEEGDILLLRSPQRGWEFPGGQVEEGEDLIQALARETREETGIAVSVGPLVGIYSNIKPPAKVMFGFLAQWEAGEPVTSSESLESSWFPREEVLEMITHPALRDRARDKLEFSGRVVYRVYRTNPYRVVKEQLL
jgi:8-oxo-dGTP diphosphatase